MADGNNIRDKKLNDIVRDIGQAGKELQSIINDLGNENFQGIGKDQLHNSLNTTRIKMLKDCANDVGRLMADNVKKET